MPTQTQITNRILRGQLLQANLTKGFVLQEQIGNFFNHWDEPVYISGLVEGLTNQLNIADYTSVTTLRLYNKLGSILGMQYIDGAALDPNAQPIGQPVQVTVPVLLGYNSDKIRFTSTNDNPQITITDWQNGFIPNMGVTWASRYGNNPIFELYSNSGQVLTGEEQTPPILTYATANDPTSDLLSVLYDFGLATDVYIQITGVSPAQASGNASGGSISPPLTFNQDNLVLDTDSDGYYLPLSLATNTFPSYVTVNGISFLGQYDTTYNPPRLYGFANNSTQIIKVQVT